jgi:hypothetical protein
LTVAERTIRIWSVVPAFRARVAPGEGDWTADGARVMVFGVGSSGKARRTDGDGAAQRASPATVALLFLGVGSIAVCGLCGGAMYVFQPHVSEDPADVRALMDELLTVDIPAAPAAVAFEPRGTINWNVAFMLSLRGAYYETQDEELDGLLMFLEVSGASLEKPQVRSHVDRVLRERSDGRIQLAPGGRSEVRRLPVRGVPCEFAFETGTNTASGDSYRLVTGTVPGRGGSEVLIALRIRQSPEWSDRIVEQLIESIE